MGEVVELPTTTYLDIPVERVIRGAAAAKLQSVVVMGWDENGEIYAASSIADGGRVLWLMEKFKAELLRGEG